MYIFVFKICVNIYIRWAPLHGVTINEIDWSLVSSITCEYLMPAVLWQNLVNIIYIQFRFKLLLQVWKVNFPTHFPKYKCHFVNEVGKNVRFML